MSTTDQVPAPSSAVGWADPVPLGAPAPPTERWAPLLAWVTSLLAAIVALRWLGGPLAIPSSAVPAAWWSWATDGDPLVVTVALLRLLALALAWYLVGVTTVALAARVLRATRLVRVADALAVGPVRVLVQQVLGVGLAAGVLTTVVPTGAAAPTVLGTGAEVMVAESSEVGVAAGPATASAARGATTPVPVPAPNVSLSVPATAPTTGAAAGVAADEPATAVGDALPAADGAERERLVASGDHFWGIAEDEVAAHLGRDGTEREVHAHWRVLVEVNADRLVAPGNPDLLLPGQRIALPVVAS